MPKERRKVPRYLAQVTAMLTSQEASSSESVRVEVLSVEGCCVRGEGIPGRGKTCRLNFRWKGGEIRTEARVVWKDPRGLAGLNFTTTDSDTISRLRALCASLELQPLTPWSAIENPHG